MNRLKERNNSKSIGLKTRSRHFVILRKLAEMTSSLVKTSQVGYIQVSPRTLIWLQSMEIKWINKVKEFATSQIEHSKYQSDMFSGYMSNFNNQWYW